MSSNDNPFAGQDRLNARRYNALRFLLTTDPATIERLDEVIPEAAFNELIGKDIPFEKFDEVIDLLIESLAKIGVTV